MTGLKKREAVFSHPYLLLLLGCLLLYILFPNGNSNNVLDARANGCLAALLAGGAVCVFLRKKALSPPQSRRSADVDPVRLVMMLCIAVCILCAAYLYFSSPFQLEILTLCGLLLLLGIGVHLHTGHRLNARWVCILLGAAAFLLRGVYILYTTYLTRQHDVTPIDTDYGHQAYILYFVNHAFQLPNFSPTSVWEFYHPPFYYFTSALWVKLQLLFGAETAVAMENVQFLTLFYSCAAVIVSYKILRACGFEGSALVVSFAVLCFHPSLILLAGSINNDMLCILFSLSAILYTLRWYQTPTRKNILLLAVCIGLAMMTKSSGALVAPAAAVLFLVKLGKEKAQRQMLWRQYAAFFAVCVPLGLWWNIYGKLRFGVPFGSFSGLTTDNPQYLGGFSAAQRLWGIDWQHLSVFENWDWQNHIFEYNLWLALLKTSLFDEATLFNNGPGLFGAQALFWINLLLVAVSLACMVLTAVFAVRGRKHLPRGWNAGAARVQVLYFAVLYVTFLLFYVWFCFSAPYACTQSFRYIVPTVLIGSAGMGSILERTRQVPRRLQKATTGVCAALCAVFCLLSTFVYLLAGMYPLQ